MSEPKAPDHAYSEPVASGWTSPARGAFAITPNDDTILGCMTRGIYVGGAGDLSVLMADDDDPVIFVAVPAGTVLPIRVNKVRSTGTTATSLVGVY